MRFWCTVKLKIPRDEANTLESQKKGKAKKLQGGGFKYFWCSPLSGEMVQFDEHIFQMGWFNHHSMTFLVRGLHSGDGLGCLRIPPTMSFWPIEGFCNHHWPGQPLIFQIFSKNAASVEKPFFGGLKDWHMFSKTNLKRRFWYHKCWGMFQKWWIPQKSDCLILESCMLLLKNCLKQPSENPVETNNIPALNRDRRATCWKRDNLWEASKRRVFVQMWKVSSDQFDPGWFGYSKAWKTTQLYGDFHVL